MASEAVDPEHAKACLQLAKDFDKLAYNLQRLDQSRILTQSGSRGTR